MDGQLAQLSLNAELIRERTEACVESKSSVPAPLLAHPPAFSLPAPATPGLPTEELPKGPAATTAVLEAFNEALAVNGPVVWGRVLRVPPGEIVLPSLSSFDNLGSVNGRLVKCAPASTKPRCRPEKPALHNSMLVSKRCTASLARPTSPVRPLSLSVAESNNCRRPFMASCVFSNSWRWCAMSDAVLRRSPRTSMVMALALSRPSFIAMYFLSTPSNLELVVITSAQTLSNPACNAFAKSLVRAKALRFSSTKSLVDFTDWLNICTSRQVRSCAPWRAS
mmetsp:Transcript_47755/g.137545  ORF Transcript_47755/g.137545 Transcript_47755/m.137545 type:complete len:280 (-) Transcript_47755:900-1739(-)